MSRSPAAETTETAAFVRQYEKWASSVQKEFKDCELSRFGENFHDCNGKVEVHNWGHTPWKVFVVLQMCKWRSDTVIHLHESGTKLEKMMFWDKLPQWTPWPDDSVAQQPQDDEHQQPPGDEKPPDNEQQPNGQDATAASSTTKNKDVKGQTEKKKPEGQ